MVSGTYYLVHVVIRKFFPGRSRISRLFNMTKLRQLRAALVMSRGGWRRYLGAFRYPVRFKIGDAFVAHGDRRRRTYSDMI